MHVHISEASKRFDRKASERHAVADFAENLPDIAVKARLGLIGEAREENAAAGIDAVNESEAPPRTLKAPNLPAA